MKNLKQNILLARIVADITADGHLQLKEHRGVVQFTSKYYKTIFNERKRFIILFGKSGSIKKYSSRGHEFYRLYIASMKIARFLKSVGVPSGNKTKINFSIPRWIKNESQKIKNEYLKGIFTCEGSIYPTRGKKVRWRIEIEQYKEVSLLNSQKFMKEIKQLLENSGIKTSPVRFGKIQKRKDGSKTIAIKLDINIGGFEKFYKTVGFDDKYKTKKLLKAMRDVKAGVADKLPPTDSLVNSVRFRS